MALDEKQQRYLNRFFPGLITAVAALGAGCFVAQPLQFKQAGSQCIRAIRFALQYVLEDGMVVKLGVWLRVRAELSPYNPADPASQAIDLGGWEQSWYSWQYGRSLGDTIFRLDLNDVSGHHVHMRPHLNKHVPAGDVEPDTRDMDPRDFVAMVATYRLDGRYPLKKKKR